MTLSTEIALISGLLEALDPILTYQQSKRIITAAKHGGYEAAMKSLKRVSAQIATAQKAAASAAAYNEGRIMALEMAVR